MSRHALIFGDGNPLVRAALSGQQQQDDGGGGSGNWRGAAMQGGAAPRHEQSVGLRMGSGGTARTHDYTRGALVAPRSILRKSATDGEHCANSTSSAAGHSTYLPVDAATLAGGSGGGGIGEWGNVDATASASAGSGSGLQEMRVLHFSSDDLDNSCIHQQARRGPQQCIAIPQLRNDFPVDGELPHPRLQPPYAATASGEVPATAGPASSSHPAARFTTLRDRFGLRFLDLASERLSHQVLVAILVPKSIALAALMLVLCVAQLATTSDADDDGRHWRLAATFISGAATVAAAGARWAVARRTTTPIAPLEAGVAAVLLAIIVVTQVGEAIEVRQCVSAAMRGMAPETEASPAPSLESVHVQHCNRIGPVTTVAIFFTPLLVAGRPLLHLGCAFASCLAIVVIAALIPSGVASRFDLSNPTLQRVYFYTIVAVVSLVLARLADEQRARQCCSLLEAMQAHFERVAARERFHVEAPLLAPSALLVSLQQKHHRTPLMVAPLRGLLQHQGAVAELAEAATHHTIFVCFHVHAASLRAFAAATGATSASAVVCDFREAAARRLTLICDAIVDDAKRDRSTLEATRGSEDRWERFPVWDLDLGMDGDCFTLHVECDRSRVDAAIRIVARALKRCCAAVAATADHPPLGLFLNDGRSVKSLIGQSNAVWIRVGQAVQETRHLVQLLMRDRSASEHHLQRSSVAAREDGTHSKGYLAVQIGCFAATEHSALRIVRRRSQKLPPHPLPQRGIERGDDDDGCARLLAPEALTKMETGVEAVLWCCFALTGDDATETRGTANSVRRRRVFIVEEGQQPAPPAPPLPAPALANDSPSQRGKWTGGGNSSSSSSMFELAPSLSSMFHPPTPLGEGESGDAGAASLPVAEHPSAAESDVYSAVRHAPVPFPVPSPVQLASQTLSQGGRGIAAQVDDSDTFERGTARSSSSGDSVAGSADDDEDVIVIDSHAADRVQEGAGDTYRARQRVLPLEDVYGHGSRPTEHHPLGPVPGSSGGGGSACTSADQLLELSLGPCGPSRLTSATLENIFNSSRKAAAFIPSHRLAIVIHLMTIVGSVGHTTYALIRRRDLRSAIALVGLMLTGTAAVAYLIALARSGTIKSMLAVLLVGLPSLLSTAGLSANGSVGSACLLTAICTLFMGFHATRRVAALHATLSTCLTVALLWTLAPASVNRFELSSRIHQTVLAVGVCLLCCLEVVSFETAQRVAFLNTVATRAIQAETQRTCSARDTLISLLLPPPFALRATRDPTSLRSILACTISLQHTCVLALSIKQLDPPLLCVPVGERDGGDQVAAAAVAEMRSRHRVYRCVEAVAVALEATIVELDGDVLLLLVVRQSDRHTKGTGKDDDDDDGPHLRESRAAATMTLITAWASACLALHHDSFQQRKDQREVGLEAQLSGRGCAERRVSHSCTTAAMMGALCAGSVALRFSHTFRRAIADGDCVLRAQQFLRLTAAVEHEPSAVLLAASRGAAAAPAVLLADTELYPEIARLSGPVRREDRAADAGASPLATRGGGCREGGTHEGVLELLGDEPSAAASAGSIPTKWTSPEGGPAQPTLPTPLGPDQTNEVCTAVVASSVPSVSVFQTPLAAVNIDIPLLPEVLQRFGSTHAQRQRRWSPRGPRRSSGCGGSAMTSCSSSSTTTATTTAATAVAQQLNFSGSWSLSTRDRSWIGGMAFPIISALRIRPQGTGDAETMAPANVVEKLAIGPPPAAPGAPRGSSAPVKSVSLIYFTPQQLLESISLRRVAHH